MRQYYYLIASLPMLEFGMKIPFSYRQFLLLCREHLSIADMEIIKRVRIEPCEDIEEDSLSLREWKEFDIALRNEIVRFRAGKKGLDPIQYIRGESYLEPYLAGLVQWATNQESPLEAELSLDRLRWERIDGLTRGHYFDIDYLIAYALKLQLLERWERINSEGGMKVLQGLVRKEML
ncbi:MAG: DUF2764 domain-containing protein [Candidatus Omnitrophica bacterium]|nr:DUF2764 domain-containing protein [Candidatus Omnitrophota bacterium]